MKREVSLFNIKLDFCTIQRGGQQLEEIAREKSLYDDWLSANNEFKELMVSASQARIEAAQSTVMPDNEEFQNAIDL